MQVNPSSIPPGHKTCYLCKQIKPFSEFRKFAKGRDGHKSYCKPCDREWALKRYKKKKKEIDAAHHKWVKDHPEAWKKIQEKSIKKKKEKKEAEMRQKQNQEQPPKHD